MSFVDKVEVSVGAGKGGDGKRSFRHERYVDKGGPDGGDGGDGGDVIFEASRNQNTLAAFRYNKELLADSGQPGGTSRKHGKSAQALVVKVPIGTQVTDDHAIVVADLVIDGQQQVIAAGGKGGFGNAHFVSSVRQAPNFAEKGEPGQAFKLILELKIIADVGLVGLPNAGKSTLLSRISNAHPEIADYPFTTLKPNLGVVDVDKQTSLLVADIPGLIEGASIGKGLGHEFLKHIERTKVIVHLIDVYQADIALSYQIIRSELKAYSQLLAKLPEIVVLNKIEGLDDSDIKDQQAKLRAVVAKKTVVMAISAAAGTNLDQLKYDLKKLVNKVSQKTEPAEVIEPIPTLTISDQSGAWQVKELEAGFLITGQKIEHFATRSDLNNAEAVNRLKVIMKRLGIIHELLRLGAKPGSRIYIGEAKLNSFDF